jgi:hypothetical protein
MDKSCTLQVRRIEIFTGNTIYFGILLSVAIELYYGGHSRFRSTELCTVVFSQHLEIPLCERNNPEELSFHLLRGGSLK